MGERRPEVGKVRQIVLFSNIIDIVQFRSQSKTMLKVLIMLKITYYAQAGKNGKVEATAGKHCQFDVPFSVQVAPLFSRIQFGNEIFSQSIMSRERSNLS